MKEIKDISEEYLKLKANGKACALATVIKVEGSAYRRPGAKMLIAEDGKLTGAISGGCLEGDALKKALNVILEKKPALVIYDTMDEEEAIIGVGLGCNGIISILIEPIDYLNKQNPIELCLLALQQRSIHILISMASLTNKRSITAGTNALFNAAGLALVNATPLELNEIIQPTIPEVLANKASVWKNANWQGEDFLIFMEYLIPPVKLVVFGAGNDVMPLIDMANLLGWYSVVVDGRANYATLQRFPNAAEVLVAKPDTALQKIDTDDHTCFCLMTHNYNYDKAILEGLLGQKKTNYIGMLGPRKKMERMKQEWKEERSDLDDEAVSNIFAPIGLHLGAETPEEIALSILSEIKMFLSTASGTSLSLRMEKIHL